MRILFFNIAIAGLLSLPAVASADELHKEIILDKDVATAQSDVNRQGITPQVNLPSVTAKRLLFSDKSTMANFTNSIARLDAAPYANHLLDGEARGYVTAGYFPVFNANLAAGYRFIDNERTHVNAWMNYNGTNYDREDLTVKRHHATIFAGASHVLNPKLMLFGNANATFDTFNYPSLKNSDDQNARQVVADIGVRSLGDGLPFGYKARLRYNHVSFSKAMPWPADNDAKPLKENKISFLGGVTANFDEHSSISLDVVSSYTRYGGDEYRDDVIGKFAEIEKKNYFKIVLNPHIDYSKGKAYAHIGLQFKATFAPKTKVYFAPDVDLQYRLFDWLGFGAQVGGGEVVNSPDRVLPIDIYASPNIHCGSGHVPLDALLSVNLGPFHGAELKLFGGYSIAHDILALDDNFITIIDESGVPQHINLGVSRLRNADMKGFRFGVSATYKWRDIVDAKVSFQMAPQKADRGYYPWLDHAKKSVEASVDVYPIKPLSVGIKYTLRTSRAAYITDNDNTIRTSLGNVNSLDAGATYRLNDNIRLHARVENLMNRHWQIFNGVPASGITGLIGATYIFR